MGISIESLNDEVRKTHRIKDEIKGVRVLSVSSRSVAAGKLQEGDIIEQVNFEDVTSLAEFEDAVQAAEKTGQAVTLLVNRRGNHVFYTFENA